MRLRDIGGIIVVYLSTYDEASRNKVIKILEDGLRKDRTRSTIQSFSNLGLLEFTRKRIGKDLGAQLRGSCPTCSGLGTVLSSQSVAIDTLRHVREVGKNGQPVVIHAAPTVAAQLDFWYEDETEALSKELSCEIHVRVDPMLHPERSRIESVAKFEESLGEVVRVGDEHPGRTAPGTLAQRDVGRGRGRRHIVEVENAANNAGGSAGSRSSTSTTPTTTCSPRC